MMISKIVSGGQTGVDRAALDAAIECDVEYGGWIPKGRKTEDGTLSSDYTEMREMQTEDYLKRTERNVRDSHATLVFCHGRPSGGTKRTIEFCVKHSRPFAVIDLDNLEDKEDEEDIFSYHAGRVEEAVEGLYLEVDKIKSGVIDYGCGSGLDRLVLNIAGPRESKSPGIYDEVKKILVQYLSYDEVAAEERIRGTRLVFEKKPDGRVRMKFVPR